MRPPFRLNDRAIIFALLVLFVSGVVFTMWHLTRLQSQLNESSALEHAKLYSEAIAEFRTLYTQEVVETVRDQGIMVTHDYKDHHGAIPLPATLSMLLGRRIGDLGSGARTHLYSAYPFPWREEEKQRLFQDPFARDAWEYWQQNPDSDEPFYRFEEFEGRVSLRYAMADRMRPSCVDCHNSHPDTPKNDWNVNDVRGVLEIITPMDSIIEHTQAGLRDTFLLMGVMTVLGVIRLVLVIDRFRRTASILEMRVKERTAELSKANTLLKQHIIQRKQAQEELQQAHERMKSDLEAAAKTQRSLLPNPPPDVSAVRFAWAFRPCDELAGDIFNVFQLDERQIGLYLLDVSGHGVQAALLSVTLNRLLAQMAQGSLQFDEAGGSQRERLVLSPAEVAARLNTEFQMDASPGAVQYFTFLYGILNTHSGYFRYVSAGHPGPLHARPDGESILHPQEGFAIGWFPDSTYQESVIELKPGDRLYLYSDGILEAMNSEDELFGHERLVETFEERQNLTLQGSVEGLVECARQWSGDAGFVDDVSILALERGVAET